MNAPQIYYVEDMLVHNEFDRRGHISKGYKIFPKNYKYVSNLEKNKLKKTLNTFILSMRLPFTFQISWSVDSNYHNELENYKNNTDKYCKKGEDDWCKFVRDERYFRYKDRMLNNLLRKEVLRIFVTRPIDEECPNNKTDSDILEHYEKLIIKYRNIFNQVQKMMDNFLTLDGGKIIPMNSQEIHENFNEILSPNLKNVMGFGYKSDVDLMSPVQSQSWMSEIKANTKKEAGNEYDFFFDGHYHAIYSITKWPSETYNGIINNITDCGLINMSITLNIVPLTIEKELDLEEKKIQRLQGDLMTDGKERLRPSINKAIDRVFSMASGNTMPYRVNMIIRLWAKTVEELSKSTGDLQGIIRRMNGAAYWETRTKSQAVNLFYTTWPGVSYTKYIKHSIKTENQYLADLLPFTSTFTGYLEQAEAIYDGEVPGSIVGVRTFIGETPQNGCTIGSSGSGKSFNISDLMQQTSCFYAFTCIMEEGNSYGLLVDTLGYDSIILHPDASYTLNYFSTGGIPISPSHLTAATILVSKMCGEIDDKSAEQVRQAQIAYYIKQLYIDTYLEWKNENETKVDEATKISILTLSYVKNEMSLGSTFLDGYIELRELLVSGSEKAAEYIDKRNSITEDEMIEFYADKEELVMYTAYSFFKEEEFPQHNQLVMLMSICPHDDHDRQEIKNISTILDQWSAGGNYGQIFDGVTNIDLKKRVVHFELGQIPESAKQMKSIIALIINNTIRNHILTMPRHLKKRMIFEELARFISSSGGEGDKYQEKIVAECYAQMRKYSCGVTSVIQQYEQFRKTGLRAIIIGNSKMYFLMKQKDPMDLSDFGKNLNLSECAMSAIQGYKNPEVLSEEDRHSSFMYYHESATNAFCGTVRNFTSREVSYIASTSGELCAIRSKEVKQLRNSNKDLSVVKIIRQLTA